MVDVGDTDRVAAGQHRPRRDGDPFLEDVTISATIGRPLVPLPEGASYLGFIFARAETPALVEAALREAHRRVEFDIEPAG